MQNIFLEENRSVFSNNRENTIDVALEANSRLLPNDSISAEMSLYEQYNRERDSCEQFRLILSVNPVCSNILFNMKTEIVINEGAPDCRMISDHARGSVSKDTYAPGAVNTTTPITYYHAIRDTEYSHKNMGGFVYHCGADIFNNHIIRNNGFVHVNKMDRSEADRCGNVFNTIMDYQRDNEGIVVEEEINVKYNKKRAVPMHLYQYDTIQSMQNAFAEKCEEQNGWWGFVNPGNIELPTNSGSVMTNRMMAGNKACEFIDLYPDRSLFSFIPKFNKYRRRLEKNWDYCITYPFESDMNKINDVCGGERGAVRAYIKHTTNTSSTPVVECHSYFKHNMTNGNYVTFYYYYPHYEILDRDSETSADDMALIGDTVYDSTTLNPDGSAGDTAVAIKKIRSAEFQRCSKKVKVIGTGDMAGDNKDRVFTVKFSDIDEIYEYMKLLGCFYKRNVEGTECQYYFRKFKKLRNTDGSELRSDINKSAFGTNIYGDDIAQVIFTDDVDIHGLKDNNDRPVSEVFFTVVKRNAGYKKWYASNTGRTFGDEDIEYSHCFGKVSSGIDFGNVENEPFDYNVRYLHNMDINTAGKVTGFTFTAAKEKTKAGGIPIGNPIQVGTLPGRLPGGDTIIGVGGTGGGVAVKPGNGEMSLTKSVANTFSAWGETVIFAPPYVLEDDITIESKDWFYGDVVEYNVADAVETVVADVCHRFNTAQRETWNTEFRDIFQDVITSDDYDKENGSGKQFKIAKYYVNDINSSVMTETSSDKDVFFGNISPEGYFYKPHLRIAVRENDDDRSESPAKYINYANPVFKTVSGQYYELQMDVPADLGFYKGDYMAFHNSQTSELTWGEITAVSGLHITLRFDLDSFSTIKDDGNVMKVDYFKQSSGKRVLYAYWSTDNVPTYARLATGSRKFIWRKIVTPSEMIKDDELYEQPFSNGRFYIEKNLSFFLRRQDPSGKYGLSTPMFKKIIQNVSNPMEKFKINGYDPIDFSGLVFAVDNALTTCY